MTKPLDHQKMKRVRLGEPKNSRVPGLYEAGPPTHSMKAQLTTPQAAHATSTSNQVSFARPINNPAMTLLKKWSKARRQFC
jgi:hypothetical protein